MTTITLTGVRDGEAARLELEEAGVIVDACEHSPRDRTLRVTTPTPFELAQRRAMLAGHRLSYITFRGTLTQGSNA